MKTLKFTEELKKWENRLEEEKTTLDSFAAEYADYDPKEAGILLAMLFDERLEYAAQDSGYSKAELADLLFSVVWEEHDESMFEAYEHIYAVAMEHDW